jgi:phosphatidylglycerophosphate synthase
MLDTYARRWVQPIIHRSAVACTKIGLTPNQVTYGAFLIGVGASVLLAMKEEAWAIAFLWVSGYLDAVDGTMARIQQKSSAWGTLLDVTFDRIVELALILIMAWQHPTEEWIALLLVAGIVFSMTIFLTVGALSEKKGVKSFYYQAGFAERTEGFLFLTLMMIFSHAFMWTTGLFVLAEYGTGLQRMMEAKKILADSVS